MCVLTTILFPRLQLEITRLTEKRILTRSDRAPLYRAYQKATSMWLPWFPRNVPELHEHAY